MKEYPEERYAFFIFDIDKFKQANDLYGHAFGDSVIQAFTKTIRENFRRTDILGRIGGDEFVAFLRIEDSGWAESKAFNLCQALNRMHTWSDKKLACIGQHRCGFCAKGRQRFRFALPECGRCAL